jgi:NADH-quinone oxidoreductase subunit H
MSLEFAVISLIKSAVVAFVLLTALAYIQWLERKVLAHIQLRVGPRRVGPHGLLQPLADVVKLITKEDMIPSHVNKVFYLLAPFMAVTFALISISVIPFGGEISGFGYKTMLGLTDINIGVLFILAISSMGVYGVALAGWSSNNKYSLIGGLRSSAQMISYELPLALAIASPLLIVNTLNLRKVVEAQSGYYFDFLPRWSIFQGPWPQIIAFVLFLIAGFAETNRVPFDLPEAENELVAGFHTEYGSMKFAAFFMAEYCNMITVCCMAVVRMASAVESRLRFEFRSGRHLSVRGGRFLFTWLQPGKKIGSLHASRCGCDLSRTRRIVSDSRIARVRDAVILVYRQGPGGSLPLHLDSRDPAALPL